MDRISMFFRHCPVVQYRPASYDLQSEALSFYGGVRHSLCLLHRCTTQERGCGHLTCMQNYIHLHVGVSYALALGESTK